MKKKCTKCKKILPATKEFFYLQKNCGDGFHSWCKSCMRKAIKKYRKKAANKRYIEHRKHILKLKYGITYTEYLNLLKLQHNKCAICGKHINKSKNSFAVDHCHKTGIIRGLLCFHCNTSLEWTINHIKIINTYMTAAYKKK